MTGTRRIIPICPRVKSMARPPTMKASAATMRIDEKARIDEDPKPIGVKKPRHRYTDVRNHATWLIVAAGNNRAGSM